MFCTILRRIHPHLVFLGGQARGPEGTHMQADAFPRTSGARNPIGIVKIFILIFLQLKVVLQAHIQPFALQVHFPFQWISWLILWGQLPWALRCAGSKSCKGAWRPFITACSSRYFSFSPAKSGAAGTGHAREGGALWGIGPDICPNPQTQKTTYIHLHGAL